MFAKSLVRLSTIVALTALLVAGSVLPAFAQGPIPSIVCNGLSDDDCQLLQNALSPQQPVHSFSIPEWAIDLNVVADQAIVIQGRGSAAVVLPQAFMALTSDLPPITDPTNIAPVITLLQALDATMVQAMLEQIGVYLVIDSLKVDAPDQHIALSAEIILKDMDAFLHVPSPTGVDAWFGQELHLSPDDLDEIDAGLQEAIASLQDEEFLKALAQMSEIGGAANRLGTLFGKHITTTRGMDAIFNGQAMAAFTTTFDLKGFLADPDLPSVVMTIVQNPAFAALMEGSEDLTGLNETQIQFLLMTAGLLIGDTDFSVEQWVGLEDGVLHKHSAHFLLNLDLSLMGEEAQVETATIDASFHLLIDAINSTTLDDVDVPSVYYDMDESEDFLAGTPAMIEADLALGQTFSGTFASDGDTQDVYALPLREGETVTFTLSSDDYPYVSVYGPDGFLIAEYDTYEAQSISFTAADDGLHLVVVEGYWDIVYEMTASAAP